MNQGEVSLDQSLKLYKEADRLIKACMTHLSEAEQQIERLIKNRNNEVQVDANQKAQTESIDTTASTP